MVLNRVAVVYSAMVMVVLQCAANFMTSSMSRPKTLNDYPPKTNGIEWSVLKDDPLTQAPVTAP